MIEYIKQRKDGTVCGGPFSDGAFYESIASESPLWGEISDWLATGGLINPVDPEPVPVTVVYNVDLWSRMTDTEAEQVGTAMAEQPFRIRKIFETANSYRSDHELWPLLVQIATALFGEERTAEILAPSIP